MVGCGVRKYKLPSTVSFRGLKRSEDMKPVDGKCCTVQRKSFRNRHKRSVDDHESFSRFIPYFEIFFCDSSDIDE